MTEWIMELNEIINNNKERKFIGGKEYMEKYEFGKLMSEDDLVEVA